MALTTAEFNRDLTTKTVDKFYVSFYRMTDNRANILGRQIHSIERPTLMFQTFDLHFKSGMNTDTAQIQVQPINAVFRDDNGSLAIRALYEQVYRQAGKMAFPSSHQEQEGIVELDDARFDLNVKVLDAQNKVVEEYTMLNCYITGITHSQYIYAEANDNLITATINCDSVDYAVVDS